MDVIYPNLLDPSGQAKASNEMTLVGHSMGVIHIGIFIMMLSGINNQATAGICPQFCYDALKNYSEPVGCWYRAHTSDSGSCKVLYIKDEKLWYDTMAGFDDPMPSEVQVHNINGTLRLTLHGDFHIFSIEYFEIDSAGNWVHKNTESKGEALLDVPPCMKPRIELLEPFIQK